MLRCSNLLLGFLNFITFILSIPIVGYGVWLATQNITECEKALALPVVIAGSSLMILSLIGMLGACCRSSGMLCLYLTLMAVAILGLVAFTVFVLAVTHKDAGETLNDKAHEQFKLVDYSHWLQKQVDDNGNWKRIKSCLSDMKICTSFADKRTNETVEKLYSKHLTSIKSGCCKPSDDCKFTYEGPIHWNKANGDYKNPDCSKWGNTVDTLCYNCESCKVAVIDQVRGYWKPTTIANASVLGLFIIFYILGCCACSNNMSGRNRSHKYNPYNNPYHYPHRGSPGGPPGGPRGPGGPYP